MPIISIEGDVLEFAKGNSKAIAPWMSKGFNTRWMIWSDLINKHNVEVELAHPKEFSFPVNNFDLQRPWELGNPTVWKIINKPEWKLRYVYIFPNETNNAWLNDFSEINETIRQCLSTLKPFDCNSVAFIQIPASLKNEKSIEDDLLSAKLLIEALKKWETEYNDDKTFFLVDRRNRFQSLLSDNG